MYETKPRHGTAGEPETAWTCRLTIVHPRPLARAVALADRSTLVGRDPGDDGLRLADDTVSRRHLELRWEAATGRHLAVDLGSRNGSALDGRLLTAVPRLLEDNAVLRIGDVLTIYERQPSADVDAPTVDRDAIPGDALAIHLLRDAVARVAPDPSPALLIGESGTGKERIVGELHRLSGRKGPLVSLNCAALSPQLIESHLFGHERGAFTGATAAQPGFFRAADGGTLFLDEIGELPLELQPKFLRAIEEGEVVPVGSTTGHRVDVRVIAATNRDLADEVTRGKFRRDLYARLALWELRVPPLRRRRADLLMWFDLFVARWAERRGQSPPPSLSLTPDAAAALLHADWPENLRGLHRLVHELVRHPGPIPRALLPEWLRAEPSVPKASPARAPRPAPSRDELLAVLARNDYSVRATARELDRDRKQISRWIARYAIVLPNRPDPDDD